MEDSAYRVLARKYRPQTFAELIGQEAMVRTLENAIRTGRLAHAFVLTGVRGVGKTTTARIIAKGLNCIAADGQGGPTTAPCGVCANCVAIADSRHLDILEMDAASRTGVDDVRELIDGVRYAPQSARFKIYIIDEVHMLSKNAFNALLKTLEEPPEHVKFIFATTEIRKVPVTILSRCQRFDLRRVPTDALIAHLGRIAEAEGAQAEPDALKLIAKAAEGSVRDSLSLLDQAIAHSGEAVETDQVRAMLGLADRTRILDLARAVFQGDSPAALALLAEQYEASADPAVVLGDLLETVHWLTRLKVTPDAGADALVAEAEREDGAQMAKDLGMPALTRAWQMLLKGLGEVREAPNPQMAAEMVLIRLCFAADLPSPADLVRRIEDGGGGSAAAPARSPQPAGGPAPVARGSQAQAQAARPHAAPPHAARTHADGQPQPDPRPQASADILEFKRPEAADPAPEPPLHSFEDLVALLERHKAASLAFQMKTVVRLVAFEPGAMTLAPADPGMAQQAGALHRSLKQTLAELTGQTWTVTLAPSGGGETLAEVDARRRAHQRDRALADPLVQSVLQSFPGARLIKVVTRASEEGPTLPEPAPDDPTQEEDMP